MAFVSGPEMQGGAWLDLLKEKERQFHVAFGPPLAYREQALLAWLSTLYPPKVEIRDPEFAADWSGISMTEFDDDGYPLQYKRAKSPMRADDEASLAASSVPAEEIDVDVNFADREKAHDASERIDVKQ
jgi:hypothetical protein